MIGKSAFYIIFALALISIALAKNKEEFPYGGESECSSVGVEPVSGDYTPWFCNSEPYCIGCKELSHGKYKGNYDKCDNSVPSKSEGEFFNSCIGCKGYNQAEGMGYGMGKCEFSCGASFECDEYSIGQSARCSGGNVCNESCECEAVNSPKTRDEDLDGVPDDSDKCPGTELLKKVDKNGCYIIYEEVAAINNKVCKRELGTDSPGAVRIFIVPCSFPELESGKFSQLSNKISSGFSNTEPFKSNHDKFVIYSVNDFRGSVIPHIKCWGNGLIVDAAKTCGFKETPGTKKEGPPGNQRDQIIAVAYKSGEAGGSFNDWNGYFSVIGSGVPQECAVTYDNSGSVVKCEGQCPPKEFSCSWDFSVRLTSLHELGHTLGGFGHTLSGKSPGNLPAPNCGEVRSSSKSPCQEWNREEYLRWKLKSDPNFGCYNYCDETNRYYRPWEKERQDIMSRDDKLIHGYTPVERKILYDILTAK